MLLDDTLLLLQFQAQNTSRAIFFSPSHVFRLIWHQASNENVERSRKILEINSTQSPGNAPICFLVHLLLFPYSLLRSFGFGYFFQIPSTSSTT